MQPPEDSSNIPGIVNPFSDTADAAIIMHSMFTELVAAGFTEDQALKMLAYISTSQPGTDNTGTGN